MRFTTRLHVSIRRSASLATLASALCSCALDSSSRSCLACVCACSARSCRVSSPYSTHASSAATSPRLLHLAIPRAATSRSPRALSAAAVYELNATTMLRCRMALSTLSTASRLLLRVITVATKALHDAASCCRIMRFTTRLHVSIRRSASFATLAPALSPCLAKFRITPHRWSAIGPCRSAPLVSFPRAVLRKLLCVSLACWTSSSARAAEGRKLPAPPPSTGFKMTSAMTLPRW